MKRSIKSLQQTQKRLDYMRRQNSLILKRKKKENGTNTELGNNSRLSGIVGYIQTEPKVLTC